jgi:thiol:disulfide interchange protein DsbD
MASSGFSIVVGLVMMGLGITMLGFGNLSFLQSIGNRMGTGKSSVKNAFFMGTGAGLVASPCTGPILATLLTVAASNADFLRSSLYLFVYSFGFAVPYVFLGRASVNLSKKRVPPRLQIIVKLFFASVMFALGFYYLRIPAYGLLKSLNEAWSTISMVSLAAGAAIGFWVSISPKLQLKKGIQIVPSILFGLGIFAGTQWMSASNTKALQATLDWYDSEEAGFSAAARLGSPILVDAWAEWCEACKKMDATTFVDPTLVKKLKDDNWVLIKLDVTQTNEKNEAILAKYKIQSLPTLTLLRPGGDMGESRQILGYVSGKSLLKHIEEFGRQ